MTQAFINVVTVLMFIVLAVGLFRRPLARWKTRLDTPAADDSADPDSVPSVPLWVAVAAGVLILSLAVLLADAYFGTPG